MKATIEDLQGLIEADVLSGTTKTFAQSLVYWAKTKTLTEKQAIWVDRLVAEALDDPGIESAEVGEFQGVIELFTQAKNKLKFPKLRFELEAVGPLQLALAGSKSKTPGWVQVTDGKPFGQNKWYGRVSPAGKFEISPRYKGSEVIATITSFLIGLAANPHATASLSGQKTGNCCFCNRTLTHKNSVTVGYGEVCSTNWGLHDQWVNATKEVS